MFVSIFSITSITEKSFWKYVKIRYVVSELSDFELFSKKLFTYAKKSYLVVSGVNSEL